MINYNRDFVKSFCEWEELLTESEKEVMPIKYKLEKFILEVEQEYKELIEKELSKSSCNDECKFYCTKGGTQYPSCLM